VSSADRPWLWFYGAVPRSLDVPEATIDQAVAARVGQIPNRVAFDFLGTTATYQELSQAIDRCAASLAALGLGHGDRLTISIRRRRRA